MPKKHPYILKDLSIQSLRKFSSGSGSQEVHFETWTSGRISTPFRMKPAEFMEYAKHDFESKYDHNFVNALSNVKRAIDCQLDSLLIGFGLFKRSKRERWNFPKKIEVLDSLGIVAPSILMRINKKRNLLEHDYSPPRRADVRDALDVVELFTSYTDRFLVNALLDCNLLDETQGETNYIQVIMDYKKGRILVRNIHVLRGGAKRIVYANQDEYIDYLRWFLSLYDLRA